jgi:hypothetical protein
VHSFRRVRKRIRRSARCSDPMLRIVSQVGSSNARVRVSPGRSAGGRSGWTRTGYIQSGRFISAGVAAPSVPPVAPEETGAASHAAGGAVTIERLHAWRRGRQVYRRVVADIGGMRSLNYGQRARDNCCRGDNRRYSSHLCPPNRSVIETTLPAAGRQVGSFQTFHNPPQDLTGFQ